MERRWIRSQEERNEGAGHSRAVEEAVLRVSADSSRQIARSANRTMISDDHDLSQKHQFRVAAQAQGLQNALYTAELRDKVQIQQRNRELDTELVALRKQRAKPFLNEVEDREDPAPPPEKRTMTLNTWTQPAARDTPILPPRSAIGQEFSDVTGQQRRVTGEPFVQVRMEETRPALSFVGDVRLDSERRGDAAVAARATPYGARVSTEAAYSSGDGAAEPVRVTWTRSAVGRQVSTAANGDAGTQSMPVPNPRVRDVLHNSLEALHGVVGARGPVYNFSAPSKRVLQAKAVSTRTVEHEGGHHGQLTDAEARGRPPLVEGLSVRGFEGGTALATDRHLLAAEHALQHRLLKNSTPAVETYTGEAPRMERGPAGQRGEARQGGTVLADALEDLVATRAVSGPPSARRSPRRHVSFASPDGGEQHATGPHGPSPLAHAAGLSATASPMGHMDTLPPTSALAHTAFHRPGVSLEASAPETGTTLSGTLRARPQDQRPTSAMSTDALGTASVSQEVRGIPQHFRSVSGLATAMADPSPSRPSEPPSGSVNTARPQHVFDSVEAPGVGETDQPRRAEPHVISASYRSKPPYHPDDGMRRTSAGAEALRGMGNNWMKPWAIR